MSSVPPQVTILLPVRRTPHPPGAWPDSPVEDTPGELPSSLPSSNGPVVDQESTQDGVEGQSPQPDSMLDGPIPNHHTQVPDRPITKEVTTTKREPSPRRLEPPRIGMIMEEGRRIYIPKYAASGHGKSCTGRSETLFAAKSGSSSRRDFSGGFSARRSPTTMPASPPLWYGSPESPLGHRPTTSSSKSPSQHHSGPEKLPSRTSRGNRLRPTIIPKNVVITDTQLRPLEGMPIIKQTIGEEKTSTDINREKEIIRQAKINAATQFAGQRARPSVSQTPSLEREPAILSVKKEIESNDSKITKGIRRWSFGFVKTESRKMMEKLRADDIVKKSGDSPYPGSLGRRFARTLKRKE